MRSLAPAVDAAMHETIAATEQEEDGAETESERETTRERDNERERERERERPVMHETVPSAFFQSLGRTTSVRAHETANPNHLCPQRQSVAPGTPV